METLPHGGPSVLRDYLRRVADWAKRNRRNGRYALRTTLSAGVAFAIAEALHLAQPTWAVISAIVVARASSGDAYKSGRDRILGTLAGAALGIGMALGRPLGVPELVLIIVGVAVLAFSAAINKTFQAAPIALVIVLASDPSGSSTIATAIHRFTEVGIGAVVAIAFALLFRQWARWRARQGDAS